MPGRRLSYRRIRGAVADRGRAVGFRLLGVDRAVVLLYHRVERLHSDPVALAIRPERFEEHLEVVRRTAEPMPLGELMRRRGEGTMPRRAVAVTIDDGYADVLERAVPLLERHGVPATLFVSTGPV